MHQQNLLLHDGARADTIDKIHRGTAIYTALPEIEALLDRVGWPAAGKQLLDPGAGNGGFLVAAIARITAARNDVRSLAARVHGYEFHPGAAAAARKAIARHLEERGWEMEAARRAGDLIVETKDFLLSDIPAGLWHVIAANPPYWRYANLPDEYRGDFDTAVPADARADLLYAYLSRCADVVHAKGIIGLVTADRWLLNAGSGSLRERIGADWSVTDIRRLDSSSAFYRPKARRRGTPARVHPVALVLQPGREGRPLTRAPFPVDPVERPDGEPLGSIATIRLAPWLGPDGIFVVRERAGLPPEHLVPCFKPEDIQDGELLPPSRWAIITGEAEPPAEIMGHLGRTLDRMPKRGRKKTSWLPPETFHGRLPLEEAALFIPRIATTLTPVLLPAGTMPINHNLVVVSGIEPDKLAEILRDPRVRGQADALALRLENGYRSYTATLLRQLVVPHDLLRR